MPYNVRVTDEKFVPITSKVVYSDINGMTVGTEDIPAAPYMLSDAYMNDDRTFGVSFLAPGYYDFDSDRWHLPDDFNITLQTKPTHTVEIIAGIGLLGIIWMFFKK